MQKLMKKGSRFQEKFTSSWNASVNKVSKLLFLNMSHHDEVTTKGALQMFVELMHDFGLTEKTGKDDYEPTENIDDQLLFVKNLLTAVQRIVEVQGDLHLAMHMGAIIFK